MIGQSLLMGGIQGVVTWTDRALTHAHNMCSSIHGSALKEKCLLPPVGRFVIMHTAGGLDTTDVHND